MMKANTVFLVSFLFVGFLFSCGLFQSDGSTELLQHFFTPETCESPCWIGIETGATSEEELISILDSQELDYEVVPIFREDEGVIYYVPLNPELPFWTREQAETIRASIGVIPTDPGVGSIVIPLDLCVSNLVDAFGEPIIVDSDSHFTLLFPELVPIIFNLDKDTGRVYKAIFLTNEVYESNRVFYRTEEAWSVYEDEFSEPCTDRLDSE